MGLTFFHIATTAVSVAVFTFLYLAYTELKTGIDELQQATGAGEWENGKGRGEVGYGTMLENTKECLLKEGRGRTKQCWADMHHELWLQELDALDAMPLSSRRKFKNPINNWEPFDLFPPTYDCDMNNVKRVGNSGDGGKWVCEPFDIANDCIIISIGSNGNFEFEKGMQQFTNGKCKIYTFDCTGSWSDPSTSFYPWCVSGVDEVRDGKTYKRLITIMKDLGLPHISYLKMDVEGYEWAVMPDILGESNQVALPHQISFELHTYTEIYKLAQVKDDDWLEPVIRLARLMDKAGYRVAINEFNVECGFCTELIIVRRDIFAK